MSSAPAGAKWIENDRVRLLIGPEGAVGIDAGSASHFVIYGGICPDSPEEEMDSLTNTLDHRRQPIVKMWGPEVRR